MVAFLVVLACAPLPQGDAQRPDIILISIDSLRADHLGSYGSTRGASPFLDELAARGSRYAHARSSAPWTLPSHTTMLTGTWPQQHTVVDDGRKIDASLPMVQETMQKAGYKTAGFVSTIYVSKRFGFDRGFDHFEDFDIGMRNNLEHPVRAAELLADAQKWIKKNGKDKPVFLFLHLYDVHYPYLPPPGYETRFNRAATPEELEYKRYSHYKKKPIKPKRMELLRGQYDECLLAVDDQLRSFVGLWDRVGRKANWLITSDHGEEFGERGSWGHAQTLYSEQLDVPLIATGPDFPASVRQEVVGHVDLAATIAGLVGSTWTGPGVDIRKPVPERVMLADTSRFDTLRLSVEAGGHRLNVDRRSGDYELFDRRADPKEQTLLDDVAQQQELEKLLLRNMGEACALSEGVLRSSKGRLWQGEQWVEELTGPASFGLFPPDASFEVDQGTTTSTDPRVRCATTSTASSLDADTRRQLEALGYVQEGEE